MLKKMGFDGKGLGKTGNGILHPVEITKKSKFNSDDREEAVNKIPELMKTSIYKTQLGLVIIRIFGQKVQR